MMNTKMKMTILLFTMVLFFTGCSDICECFHGTGDVVSEERNLPLIQGVYLTSNVDLIVHVDSVRRMRVTAGENLVEGIETKVESGILQIRNTNKCNWVRKLDPKLEVEIWTDQLESIFIEDGNGDVTFTDTLKGKIFRMDIFNGLGNYHTKTNSEIITLAIHNGPADIVSEGTADNLYMYHVGYGKMNCLLLESKNVYINNRGTNDIYTNALNILDAKIEYIGNIYYKGNPGTITQQITGTGKIIKL
jgi:hypothetical protein